MEFLERLDSLMKEYGLNMHTLSKKSGVPYSTIKSLYTKGYDNVKLGTVAKLAKALNVSYGYLTWGERSLPASIAEEDIEKLAAVLGSELSEKRQALIEVIQHMEDSDLDVLTATATAINARRDK